MESFEGSEVRMLHLHVKIIKKTHRKDDLWKESRVMQEMLVDTCRLSVEFSPRSACGIKR
jgi:hypothetical protein